MTVSSTTASKSCPLHFLQLHLKGSLTASLHLGFAFRPRPSHNSWLLGATCGWVDQTDLQGWFTGALRSLMSQALRTERRGLASNNQARKRFCGVSAFSCKGLSTLRSPATPRMLPFLGPSGANISRLVPGNALVQTLGMD